MKKSIFAVCDLEASYACNLTAYLNEKKSTPFEVQAFTNVEHLMAFARENPLEILLISHHAMREEIRELPIRKVIILSEGEPLDQSKLEEYPVVYKYQSSDSLISEVMEYYAAGSGRIRPMPKLSGKTEIYGIYSPVRRTRKTSFALTLGEILSETKSVLYLNLEEYSGFEQLFGSAGKTDLSDLIYYFRQDNGNMIYRLNSAVQTFHELQYIPPAVSPLDLKDVTVTEWISFLQELTSYCEYDRILLDLGDQIEDLYQLLDRCDRIYMPVREDFFSEAKVQQFEKLMEVLGRKDILRKIRKIHPPAQTLTREGQDLIQQMVWGEMGNFIRMLLWQEEKEG